jgi:hypothetical protein
MSVRRPHQRDLFESDQTLPEMLPDQRGKVMVLLQAFLLEAAVERAIDQDATTNEEAGDDEDRA